MKQPSLPRIIIPSYIATFLAIHPSEACSTEGPISGLLRVVIHENRHAIHVDRPVIGDPAILWRKPHPVFCMIGMSRHRCTAAEASSNLLSSPVRRWLASLFQCGPSTLILSCNVGPAIHIEILLCRDAYFTIIKHWRRERVVARLS